MRVLLIEDVKGIGKRMEVKTVSDGYARNFLIPRKLATAADEKALAAQRAWQDREAARDAERKQFADRLARETFTVPVKTGTSGELYASVTPAQVQKILAERGFGMVDVVIAEPIRTLGEHRVAVHFGRGIRGTARITVAPTSVP